MNVYLKRSSDAPTQAGLAKLEYTEVSSPTRQNETITLPKKDWGLYQLNNDFSQFLVVKGKPDTDESSVRKAWFGGTDEKPFLVELGPASDWVDIWRAGEFYEIIKPEIIKRFEKHFGTKQTVRQGDMFCYPMPIQDWGKLLCVFQAVGGLHFTRHGIKYDSKKDSKLDPYPTIIDGPYSLYNTRHCFYGEIAIWGQHLVGKGTLKAPDHTDLTLPNICVIAQTANLKKPKEAD